MSAKAPRRPTFLYLGIVNKKAVRISNKGTDHEISPAKGFSKGDCPSYT